MKKLLITLYKCIAKYLSPLGITRYSPIRKTVVFIITKLKSDYLYVSGDKLYLDKLDSLHLSIYNNHEAWETEVLKKIVKKGDIIVDIGAHIGYYSLLFAKIVGNKGKVYAFEPDKNNFKLLMKNIKTNGYNNIIPVEKALSNKNQKIRLYISDENRIIQNSTVLTV